MISIRTATENDMDALCRFSAEAGDHKNPEYFKRCLDEQQVRKRALLVAGEQDVLIGCVHLVWQPLYQPFRRLDIPEIQDLKVVPRAQRQGTGSRLVDACEELARNAGKSDIGIGVGLYASYGAAQRLYARKGYIPDGAGICYDDVPVHGGELRAVDDLLTLKLVKKL